MANDDSPRRKPGVTSRGDARFEEQITEMLANEEYSSHPLRSALASLLERYSNQLAQLEKLTSISDGYQSALRDSNQSLSARYGKQLRQIEKIVRISDHYQKMMREMHEQLKIVSSQDPLTALPNRRLMQERLKSEAAKARRCNTPFALALVDVDHFKHINDTWGHDIGDSTLVRLAQELVKQLRGYDLCARWGGEEFLALLPETTGAEALEIAHRLRLQADALSASVLPSEVRLSVSIGVAEHRPGELWESTLKRADDALYTAKSEGRNRVALSE
jgi:diguanylate cyclase (GGDEF)-like protein